MSDVVYQQTSSLNEQTFPSHQVRFSVKTDLLVVR